MSYVLGQYNHTKSVDTNNFFMTPITEGAAGRKKQPVKEGTKGGKFFEDEYVIIPGGFQKGINYYFHGSIKRMRTTQTFDIKLEDKITSTTEEINSQFIKTINILSGDETEWVDISFIFTPVADFDYLLFELRRIDEDYTKEGTRYPIIIYEELSSINNILSYVTNVKENNSDNLKNIPLLKIGIQANPGLMMCINGEQIYVGLEGIYEIRNGIIKINSFSVVNAANSTGNIENRQKVLAARGAGVNSTTSECLFDKVGERIIDSFTLDYMYEREVN